MRGIALTIGEICSTWTKSAFLKLSLNGDRLDSVVHSNCDRPSGRRRLLSEVEVAAVVVVVVKMVVFGAAVLLLSSNMEISIKGCNQALVVSGETDERADRLAD